MKYSTELFLRAQQHIPGGVNSPVRSFKGVDSNPLFFTKGEGPYLIDADGDRYIDYVGSWGPLILGHAHPAVVKAVQDTAKNGLSFGAPTELEILLAEKIKQIMPSIELVRMVNSGTEATMSAIRLARGFTSRPKIIKFSGCYHGHADSLLVEAGSGNLTLGIPSSPGVIDTANTLVATFNDLDSVEQLFAKFGSEIAAVIVEPIAGNMNLILPQPGFLKGLRELCDHYRTVLIFDEVMTGFRVALGGAQSLYQVTPDLTTLGKIIGGGMPVGAFGGKATIMEHLAPIGPVYQAGTLSGNPVAMAAGLATLNEISTPDFFTQLNHLTQTLMTGLNARAGDAKIPFTTQYCGGLFGLFFSQAPVITCYQQATQCNRNQFKQFFHGMLNEKIYFAPSMFEAGFISIVHDTNVMMQTLTAAEKVFANLC